MAKIIGYEDSLIYGYSSKSYYYKGFEDRKVWVVTLNSNDVYSLDDGKLKYSRTDISATFYSFKQKQLMWLTEEALNFEEKTDKWSAIFICHAPFRSEVGSRYVQNRDVAIVIVQARKLKTTQTSTTTIEDMRQSVSIDHSSKKDIDIVGVLHGHEHTDTIVDVDGLKFIGTTWSRNPDDDLD